MRIPTRKVYRAFEQFDEMADAECERYLQVLGMQGRLKRWAPWTVFVVGAVASFFTSPLTVEPAVAGLRGLISRGDRFEVMITEGELLFTGGDAIVTLVIVSIVIGIPAFISMLLRDWLIHRALSQQVQLARCAKCTQNLIGLPLDHSDDEPRVRCPECGVLWLLSDLGLEPSDLRVDAGAS